MTGRAMPRRRLLTALLLVPPALAACAPSRSAQADGPDPLVALAEAARADAALAAAVITAKPDLAGRVGPLRDARAEHAAALEAEVAHQAGTTATPRPSAAPTPAAAAASLGELVKSVKASGEAAGKVVLTADVHRVGLVASVAACCATYAAVLG